MEISPADTYTTVPAPVPAETPPPEETVSQESNPPPDPEIAQVVDLLA